MTIALNPKKKNNQDDIASLGIINQEKLFNPEEEKSVGTVPS